jgi:hypothetical protein
MKERREIEDKKNLIGRYIHVCSSLLVVLSKDPLIIYSSYDLNMGKR